MQFSCPKCTQKIKCPEEAAGRKATCPKCGHQLRIPSPPANDANIFKLPSALAFSSSSNRDYEAEDRNATVTRLVPHRATIIFILGLTGLIGTFIIYPLFICGIFAWTMGREDLREMAAGRMDPDGESMTRTGYLTGKIGTIVAGSIAALFVVFFGLYFFACCGCIAVPHLFVPQQR